jgi:Protein of unknown function (DUF3618)
MAQSTVRMTEARSDTVLSEQPRDYDSDKPLHEIEQDIARTRVRLGATIQELECELAPARVAELLRRSLEPRPGPIRAQARDYAIPLALIVAGLGWLAVLRRSRWARQPSAVGEMSAEAVETGETPFPAASHADLAGPVEPVSLVDEKTAIG